MADELENVMVIENKICKEMLLQAFKGCTTKKQVADKLNRDNAFICYLVKKFNIAAEVNKMLENNKELLKTKESP